MLFAGVMTLGAALPCAFALDMSEFGEGRVNKTARRTGLAAPTAEEMRNVEMAPVTRAVLPAKADLSHRFPTPLDQGEQANCVAWAVGYAARSYYSFNAPTASRSAQDVVSPAYIFNTLNRMQKGRADCQTPISIPAALNLLKSQGAVPWTEMSYNSKDCLTQASAEALARHGPRFRISDYKQIEVGHIRFHLSRGNPVIFAMKLTREFDTWDTEVFARNGPFKSTARDGREHAMVMTAYDNGRQAFKFINSWSNEWGEGGFGWIDYRALEALWMDGWIIETNDAPAGNVPPPPAPPRPPAAAVAPRMPDSTGAPQCAGAYSTWTNCVGTATYANGDTYTGAFSNGRRHGKGTYTHAAGGTYTGDYKEGQRDGEGTMNFPSGSVFTGQFRDGRPHGRGTYTFVAGQRYVGEMQDGRIHGQGVLHGPNGNVIQSGRWVEGKFAP